MRPSQWVKNTIVLAPLVFSQNLFEPGSLAAALLAFATFCLASSACYVFNDLVDRRRDASHPLKSNRPLASGRVGSGPAVVLACVLAAASFALGIGSGAVFASLLTAFLALQALYTLFLKRVLLADAVVIAAGFLLRAAAGVVAIGARMSPWLFLCTFVLALFLALAKRRHELTLLGATAGEHRDVLGRYTGRLLDVLIAVAAVAVVGAYIAYSLWPPVAENLGTTQLYLTIPFVVFGVLRYLFLVYGRADGGNPTGVLLADLPLQTSVALWIATVLILLYR
jgi:4-hydroxybenzoate polyprenyltransferase